MRSSLLFVALAGLYYLLFGEFPRDSDSAANYLAGADWFRGNWRMHRWTLPSDNFLNSDLLLYGILSRLCGVRIEVCYLAPALIWAAVVTLAVRLAIRLGPPEQARWSALTVLALLGLPLLHCNPELVLVTYSPYHNGSMVYWLASLLCLHEHLKARSLLWLAVYLGLTAMNCFGDPMVIVLGVLPLLTAVLYHEYRSEWKGTPYRPAAMASVAAVLLGRILLAWAKAGGFHSQPLPLGFSEFSHFSTNLELVLHSPFVFAGADFWGHSLALAKLVGLAVIFVRLPLLFFQFRTMRELRPDNCDFLSSVLYCVVLLDLAASLVSSSVFLSEHVRYLTPAFIALNVLLAARAPLEPSFRKYLGVCLSVSLAYTLGVAGSRIGKPPVQASAEQVAAVGKLLELKVNSGFGYFWDAGLTTVLSRERLLTRPLFVDTAGKAHPYNWTSPTDWFLESTYTQPEFYVITRTQGRFEFLTREQAVGLFGPPKREIPIGTSVVILIYDTESSRAVLKQIEQEALSEFSRT